MEQHARTTYGAVEDQQQPEGTKRMRKEGNILVTGILLRLKTAGHCWAGRGRRAGRSPCGRSVSPFHFPFSPPFRLDRALCSGCQLLRPPDSQPTARSQLLLLLLQRPPSLPHLRSFIAPFMAFSRAAFPRSQPATPLLASTTSLPPPTESSRAAILRARRFTRVEHTEHGVLTYGSYNTTHTRMI